jgi:release factor glutamine methyltransferase
LNEFLEIGTALADGTERLRSVSDSPMLDAELLLARAIDVPRTYLIAHPEDTLDPAAVERFFSAVERRSAGMPIAYISGEKEFWSMTLNVSPDTLVPRPETEVLVDHALQRIPDIEGFSVLDLGTGSGAIALAIARDRPNCDITATDISDAALAVARENANRHALANVEFLSGDWSEPVVGRTFDMIVSNPPYVASADPAFEFLAHEPRLALAAGEDGLAAIRRISIEALSVIRKGGHLLVEHGETQYEEVVRIFSADGWDNISHANDLAGKPRVTIATGQAN